MTKEQEKRWVADLERISKSTVAFIRYHGQDDWSVGFESELAAYRVFMNYLNTPNLKMKYSTNLSLWVVSVIK